jgi:hypothetical protein
MTHLEKIYIDNIPVYAFLLFLFGAGLVFIARSPVVVVTDDVFSAVYGARREHFKRIEMSARLFRLVKLVRISAEAELDAVVFAVQDAARNPLAAVFPYRYYNAALRYASTNPRPVTVVLAGLNSLPAAAAGQGRPAILFVKQDEETDFYRAGLCAALFSTRSAAFEKLPDGDKTVLVIAGEKTSANEVKSIFEQGLSRGGSGASCVVRGSNDNYPVTDLSCVVFFGQSTGFLYHSSENSLPNIVFSWLDPDFSSPNVKVIIDDSPLQLLPLIVKSQNQASVKSRLTAGEDAEIFLPSTFKVMAPQTESLPLMLSLNIAAHFQSRPRQDGAVEAAN